MKLSNEEKMMLAVSKDTTEKRNYLIQFNNRMEMEYKKNTRSGRCMHGDHYVIGMKENPMFWKDIYDDSHLPENGRMGNQKPKIGKKYQTEKLESILSSKDIWVSKSKNFKSIPVIV